MLVNNRKVNCDFSVAATAVNVNQTSKYGKVQAAFEGDSGTGSVSLCTLGNPRHRTPPATGIDLLSYPGAGVQLRALCRSMNIRGEPINMIDQRPSKWKESNSDLGRG